MRAVPQVRGELATVLATSVLSVLATLFAVRWIGTPLHVKYPCAGAVAAGTAALPAPGGRHDEAVTPIAGDEQRARAQWLAQARESFLQRATRHAVEPDNNAGCVSSTGRSARVIYG